MGGAQCDVVVCCNAVDWRKQRLCRGEAAHLRLLAARGLELEAEREVRELLLAVVELAVLVVAVELVRRPCVVAEGDA